MKVEYDVGIRESSDALLYAQTQNAVYKKVHWSVVGASGLVAGVLAARSGNVAIGFVSALVGALLTHFLTGAINRWYARKMTTAAFRGRKTIHCSATIRDDGLLFDSETSSVLVKWGEVHKTGLGRYGVELWGIDRILATVPPNAFTDESQSRAFADAVTAAAGQSKKGK